MHRPSPILLIATIAIACSKASAASDAAPNPPQTTPSSSVAPPPPPPTAATSAASATVTPPSTCPRVLAGKPEAWKARASAASSPTARDAVLAELGLVVPTPGPDQDGNPVGSWGITAITLTKAALATARAEDYWVEVRFAGSHGALPAQGVASAALIKQADGTYCSLVGPRESQAFSEHACLGGPEVWPIAFHLFHIINKDRMTVVAERSSGRCGDGCGRAGEVEIDLLDVQGFSLVSLFHQQTFSAQYSGCPLPPEALEQASVEWVGPGLGGPIGSPTPAPDAAKTYPRDLLVVEETECVEPGLRSPYSTSVCTPEAKETRYAFTHGRYEQTGSRALTAPVAMLVPLVEGGLDDGSGRAWAERGLRLLQKSKLDEAEAYCQLALRRATDTEIRASTFYNLALIAETRGEARSACGFVKESLAIRPNNGTTKAKRAEVCD